MYVCVWCVRACVRDLQICVYLAIWAVTPIWKINLVDELEVHTRKL